MENNDTQVSGFAVVKKAPSPRKKNNLKKKKKILPALFVQIRSTKRWAEIF